jgi:hypothetical protein
MLRFTIRDVLWLMVVVAVAPTLWLGWSRETANLKADHAAKVAKLRHERGVTLKGMWKEYTKLLSKSKKQEAELERLKATSQSGAPDEKLR